MRLRLALFPLASALCFAPLLLPTSAGAQAEATSGAEDQASRLASLQDLVLRANYRQALPAARAYLQRNDLTALARIQGLEILATVHLAMRDEAAAQPVLMELFARDPGFRLSDPEASPVVQSAFGRARAQATAWTISLTHEPPELRTRTAPILAVQVADHVDAVLELRLQYRRRGDASAASVVLALDASGAAQGRIPLEGDAAYVIEYWLTSIAPSGHVQGTLGSADAPLTIEVPAELTPTAVTVQRERDAAPVASGGDVTGEPWFWVVLGVVVVGAGVGVGVGVAIASEGPQNGSLGNTMLPLVHF